MTRPFEDHVVLPLREWIELGQELNDRMLVRGFKWFRAWHTEMISIGHGCSIEADGKVYGPGKYILGRPQPGVTTAA